MVKRLLCILSVVVFCFSLLLFCSCSRSRIKDDEISGLEEKEDMREEAAKRLDNELITEEELEGARKKVAEFREQEGVTLSKVYFAFDDFSLDEKARTTLAQDAAWLINHPDREVIIEGHCDERGTEEYNLALGERRAKSVKRYLVILGVNESQLSTISFGEERPADPGHNEEAWAKNRRVEFVIQ